MRPAIWHKEVRDAIQWGSFVLIPVWQHYVYNLGGPNRLMSLAGEKVLWDTTAYNRKVPSGTEERGFREKPLALVTGCLFCLNTVPGLGHLER